MSYTWLVTGSSRGIGLEFVRQLTADHSNTVFATCRSPDSSSALQSLKNASRNLHIVQLDVRDEGSISTAVCAVQGILGARGLDYLINNAGQIHGTDKFAPFSSMLVADLTENFLTNVAGPALVLQAFLPVCEKSQRKVVANISSAAGSFARKDFGAVGAAYCVSKAALNMLSCKQAKERADMIVVAINPGSVKTDMGAPNAPLLPAESVASMLKIIHSATGEISGRFINHTGEEISW